MEPLAEQMALNDETDQTSEPRGTGGGRNCRAAPSRRGAVLARRERTRSAVVERTPEHLWHHL